MYKNYLHILVTVMCLSPVLMTLSCYAVTDSILTGANQVDKFLPELRTKKIGLMVNQTSMRNDEHIVDYFISEGVNIIRIFAPEHGFRGEADAGAVIKDGVDISTGISVVSLYGQKKKPSDKDLADIDIVIFDIQDVGVRYYTYISSLHYLMEACAEQGVEVYILDRPNPNGHYVDGPVLDTAYKSFVGMHPVPVVHGMTVGEYALMIKGEKWINKAVDLKLTIIPCKNYRKSMRYDLPVRPSPNLPNTRSILLYPQLCLFEGTDISIGRGTDRQFQLVGHPLLHEAYNFYFTPKSGPGASYPKHDNQKCYGIDLTELNTQEIFESKSMGLDILTEVYRSFPNKSNFFLKNNFFDKLAGGPTLRNQIIEGLDPETIKSSWQLGLKEYKLMRSDYLMYPI